MNHTFDKDGNYDDILKGPWIVRGDVNDDHVFTAQEPNVRICNVYGGIETERGRSIAQLIAAAPQMRDALIEIAKGRGPFKREPLEFATACLDHAVETAKAALMEIGVEPVAAESPPY